MAFLFCLLPRNIRSARGEGALYPALPCEGKLPSTEHCLIPTLANRHLAHLAGGSGWASGVGRGVLWNPFEACALGNRLGLLTCLPMLL